MAKTFKNLFDKIYTFDNLVLAAKKAQKGKRFQPNVASFNLELETQLLQLKKEIQEKSYLPGKYRTFYVFDPKKRMISAAPYRDRVVHHALCNIIEPVFEQCFIPDTFANRKGKGSHSAIERYQYFAKKYAYVLKCDIRKYFPSIDHQLLKKEIRWKIACTDTLWLIDKIIDNSNQQESVNWYFPEDNLFSPTERRKGLPIGNLTSQLWANVYLARFDHWVCHTLQNPAYIRYVDDFVLFHHDKKVLQQYKNQIARELAKLRLIIHPNKSAIYPANRGVPFLGFRVYPYHRVLKKQNFKNYRRKLKKRLFLYRDGKISQNTLECSINSWLLGHAAFGRNRFQQERIISDIYAQGVNLVKSPRGSWRLLEQQR